MPIINYDETARILSVGVAFEMRLDGVTIRRGVILSSSPDWGTAWFQRLSEPLGEDPDPKPLNYQLDGRTFSRLVFAPVPEPFVSWVKKVPSSVKAACGVTRKRPGPKPKHSLMMPSEAHELTSDVDDLQDGPGCDPPTSPHHKEAPMAQQVAVVSRTLLAICEKLQNVDEKLDRVLHLSGERKRAKFE